MLCRVFVLLLLTVVLVNSDRFEVDVNNDWKFDREDHPNAQDPAFDDSAWSDISVPHTYNANDGQIWGKYYRGIAWYRKHYKSDSRFEGRKLFLHFDGVSIIADVYLNGKRLGQHHGAYSIFRYDATYDWKHNAENVIAVKVNNSETEVELPLTADFTQFGGIYRRVKLISTLLVHFTNKDFGSSGLFLSTSRVSTDLAVVNITAKVFNSNNTVNLTSTIKVSITDDRGQVVATASNTQTIHTHSLLAFNMATTINKPRLWNGRKDPYLYTVTAQVQVGSVITDAITQKLGIRTYHLDKDKGFFLNGESYRLHGTSMHQDRLNKGWAVSQDDLANDMSFQYDIGATGMRLAHYQHDQIVYDLADKIGIVVWAELPLVDNAAVNPEFYKNAQSLMVSTNEHG
jgi:beta-galactosidase